tara:strand:- start:447 stop:587 length:141 start_codon:yes stop_codon:yes gene_type:complete
MNLSLADVEDLLHALSKSKNEKGESNHKLLEAKLKDYRFKLKGNHE